MTLAFPSEAWKEQISGPGTPMNQPSYTQSVARKKLEHYSYLLTDAIGKGYSSQVFRGRNDLTNEQVAIKVINMSMLKSEVHQALLSSEIECLKTLVGCRSIIQLYEVYTTKNNTYIITELCEDGDLSKLIKKKKLPEQRALQMIEQLVGGYLEIHRRNILHRDLKPANIFLKGDSLKIADFGFAIRSDEQRKTANYNVGSPLYMPPEALTNNKYSFKSDIWALGVVFFEMLTGRAPWKAKSEQDLSRKITSEPIETLLPPDISTVAIEFLTKTLQSDINIRMSPEELERFSFSPKYFIDLKTSVKLQAGH